MYSINEKIFGRSSCQLLGSSIIWCWGGSVIGLLYCMQHMSSGISMGCEVDIGKITHTAMSHTYTPFGRVNSKSMALILLLGSVPRLYVREE